MPTTRRTTRRVGLFTVLGRGLRRKCAVCGTGGLFTSWFRMVPACPTCGRTFEREDGYWLGAMTVNFAITELVFGIVFIGGMLATWPDVPWAAILIGGLAANLLIPLAFYPTAKTVWIALDVCFFDRNPTT